MRSYFIRNAFNTSKTQLHSATRYYSGVEKHTSNPHKTGKTLVTVQPLFGYPYFIACISSEANIYPL